MGESSTMRLHAIARNGPSTQTDWDGTPLCWCGQRWPCDFEQMRAIADELVEASWGHSWRDMWHTGVVRPDECKVCAALAKWEASR